MNRTRTRDNIADIPWSGHTVIRCETAVNNRLFAPRGAWFDQAQTTEIVLHPLILSNGTTGTWEQITDVIGNSENDSFNPVSHEKRKYDAPLVTVECVGVLRHDDSVVEGRAESVFNCGVDKTKLDYYCSRAPFTATDDQMLSEAASKCHPGVVKPRFDISLQLGELAEAFKGFHSLVLSINAVRDHVDRNNKWGNPAVRKLLGIKNFERWSIRDWVSLANSLDLGYTLAVKPFIAAWKQADKAMKDIDSVKRGYQSSEEVYHGVSARSASLEFQTLPNTSTFKSERAVVNVIKEVRATVKVKYGANSWISDGQPSRENPNGSASWRHFTENYYNLRLSSATAWALMPFSFVIDWFTGFGRVLAQWDERPLKELEYEILETGWSVKTTTNVWVEYTLCVGIPAIVDYGLVTAPGLITGSMSSVSYVRALKSFDPTIFTPSPPKFGLPNVGQTITMIELLFSLKGASEALYRPVKAGAK